MRSARSLSFASRKRFIAGDFSTGSLEQDDEKINFRSFSAITDTVSVVFAPIFGAKSSISVKPIQALL
jgi:hypothetical protein